MSNPYDEDYFLRGRESGKSLYEDYRWLPDLTVPMCQRIAEHCGIERGQRVLDFGCARGYSVRALRGLGYDAWGIDVSEWAVKNCDGEARPYLNLAPNGLVAIDREFDWIIAKDVLEHLEYVQQAINELVRAARCGLFVVVPLSKFNKGRYVVTEYEKDVTHKQRYNLATWAEMFIRPGWRVEAAYRVEGVKDNYAKFADGNGFVTCRRV